MADYFTIAGLTMTGVQFAYELIKDGREALTWAEEDLPVDGAFLNVAIEVGHLPPSEYSWMLMEKVPTAELRGSHETVFFVNASKGIRYRLIRGTTSQTPTMLVRKLKGDENSYENVKE
ncbi:MAG: hypothetical protein AAF197_09235 [Pseudomonadota bacterium]